MEILNKMISFDKISQFLSIQSHKVTYYPAFLCLQTRKIRSGPVHWMNQGAGP